MVTTRTALGGACLALAMLTAAGCAQLNEAVNDRDLECNEVPENICVRLADHADPLAAADIRTVVRIEVRPTDCGDFEHAGMVRPPGMVRCWGVEASAASGAGVGWEYYQTADGRIFDGANGGLVGD